MTYRELLEKLSKLSNDQLDNMDVTIRDVNGEYFPAEFEICGPCSDVLDPNHPLLVVKD